MEFPSFVKVVHGGHSKHCLKRARANIIAGIIVSSAKRVPSKNNILANSRSEVAITFASFTIHFFHAYDLYDRLSVIGLSLFLSLLWIYLEKRFLSI